MSDRLHLTPGIVILLMVALGFGLVICLAVQLMTVLGAVNP